MDLYEKNSGKQRSLKTRPAATKVYVFVGIFQGVLDTVEAYRTPEEAEKAFRRYTGKSYRNILRRMRTNPDLSWSYILGENLDECKIVGTVVR